MGTLATIKYAVGSATGNTLNMFLAGMNRASWREVGGAILGLILGTAAGGFVGLIAGAVLGGIFGSSTRYFLATR